MRLTKTRLYYAGRSIESGDIKLVRQENGMWAPQPDETDEALRRVYLDQSIPTLRAKARLLAPILKTTEEAAMSRLRRLGHTILPPLGTEGNEINISDYQEVL